MPGSEARSGFDGRAESPIRERPPWASRSSIVEGLHRDLQPVSEAVGRDNQTVIDSP